MNKRPFNGWGILLPGLLLYMFGLLSIYSATYGVGLTVFFHKQLVFGAFGIVLAVLCTFIPIRVYRNWATFTYLLGLLLLVAVLFMGKTVYGSKSWIVLGGFSFQPAELAKLGFILLFAAYVQRPEVSLQSVRDTLVVALFFLFPFALIMLQPDFGSASVFIALFIGMSLWGGMDLLLLFALLSPIVAIVASMLGNVAILIAFVLILSSLLFFAIVHRRSVLVLILILLLNIAVAFSARFLYDHVLKPHQRARIDAFLNPYSDPYGSGYHVIQSMIAVGSGGITGKGFLQGTQTQLRYIPKQWTDFIFCVPAEEFGFIGGVTILLLYAFLIYHCLKLAKKSKRIFDSLVAIGVATLWLYHVVINVGMTIGLVPVVGIPLPFLSAGGSALLVNFIFLGVLLNIARHV